MVQNEKCRKSGLWMRKKCIYRAANRLSAQALRRLEFVNHPGPGYERTSSLRILGMRSRRDQHGTILVDKRGKWKLK